MNRYIFGSSVSLGSIARNAMLVKLHDALTGAAILINPEEIRLVRPATVWHRDEGSIVEMKGQAGKDGEVYRVQEDLDTIESLITRLT